MCAIEYRETELSSVQYSIARYKGEQSAYRLILAASSPFLVGGGNAATDKRRPAVLEIEFVGCWATAATDIRFDAVDWIAEVTPTEPLRMLFVDELTGPRVIRRLLVDCMSIFLL